MIPILRSCDGKSEDEFLNGWTEVNIVLVNLGWEWELLLLDDLLTFDSLAIVLHRLENLNNLISHVLPTCMPVVSTL